MLSNVILRLLISLDLIISIAAFNSSIQLTLVQTVLPLDLFKTEKNYFFETFLFTANEWLLVSALATLNLHEKNRGHHQTLQT